MTDVIEPPEVLAEVPVAKPLPWDERPHLKYSRYRRIKFPIKTNRDARIFIDTRYSLLRESRVGWALSKLSFEEHRAVLFSEERLKKRLALFSTITLPSLDAQTLPMEKGKRELRLLISAGMPYEQLTDLVGAIGHRDWVRLVKVQPDEEFPAPSCDAEYYGTVRLDDDDALSRGFMARLSGYVNKRYVDHSITFPMGFVARLDDDLTPNQFGMRATHKIAAGLAHISGPASQFKSIYHVGNHGKVDQKTRLIIDDWGPSFLQSVHGSNDSGAHARIRRDEKADRRMVERYFGLAPLPTGPQEADLMSSGPADKGEATPQ